MEYIYIYQLQVKLYIYSLANTWINPLILLVDNGHVDWHIDIYASNACMHTLWPHGITQFDKLKIFLNLKECIFPLFNDVASHGPL
jgi:hypothetical protein